MDYRNSFETSYIDLDGSKYKIFMKIVFDDIFIDIEIINNSINSYRKFYATVNQRNLSQKHRTFPDFSTVDRLFKFFRVCIFGQKLQIVKTGQTLDTIWRYTNNYNESDEILITLTPNIYKNLDKKSQSNLPFETELIALNNKLARIQNDYDGVKNENIYLKNQIIQLNLSLQEMQKLVNYYQNKDKPIPLPAQHFNPPLAKSVSFNAGTPTTKLLSPLFNKKFFDEYDRYQKYKDRYVPDLTRKDSSILYDVDNTLKTRNRNSSLRVSNTLLPKLAKSSSLPNVYRTTRNKHNNSNLNDSSASSNENEGTGNQDLNDGDDNDENSTSKKFIDFSKNNKSVHEEKPNNKQLENNNNENKEINNFGDNENLNHDKKVNVSFLNDIDNDSRDKDKKSNINNNSQINYNSNLPTNRKSDKNEEINNNNNSHIKDEEDANALMENLKKEKYKNNNTIPEEKNITKSNYNNKDINNNNLKETPQHNYSNSNNNNNINDSNNKINTPSNGNFTDRMNNILNKTSKDKESICETERSSQRKYQPLTPSRGTPMKEPEKYKRGKSGRKFSDIESIKDEDSNPQYFRGNPDLFSEKMVNNLNDSFRYILKTFDALAPVRNIIRIQNTELFIYCTENKLIGVLDLRTINSIYVKDLAHEHSVNYISQTENGEILTCSEDNSIKIWRLYLKIFKQSKNSLDCIFTIKKAHKSSINKIMPLTFLRFCTCSADKTIKIWSSENYELLAVLSGHLNEVTSVLQLKFDGKLVSGSMDKTLKFWELDDREVFCLKTIKNVEVCDANSIIEVKSLGKIITGGKSRIFIFKTEGYSFICKIHVNEYPLKDIFSLCMYNKKDIICGDESGNIILIDLVNLDVVKSSFKKIHYGIIFGISMLDDLTIVTCSEDGFIKSFVYE